MGAHNPHAPLRATNPHAGIPALRPPALRWTPARVRLRSLLAGAALGWLLGFGGLGSAVAQPRDYSAGVAKFRQLGLPDVRQAKYVRLEGGYTEMFEVFRYGAGPELSGNAWLLATKPDGSATVLVDQVRVVEVVPPALAEQRLEARREAVERTGGAGAEELVEDSFTEWSGTWKEADLGADVRVATEYLQAIDDRQDYVVKMSAASLFLFAAQVHDRGLTAEANALIGRLFERVGDSRVVLSAAMGRVAEQEYAKAYRAFAAGGEWKAFLAASEAVRARFSSVWRRGPLLTRVTDEVRRQLDGGTAALPDTATLSAEDRLIVEALGRPEAVVSHRHPLLNGCGWLLEEPAAKPADPRPDHPLDLLQRRGVEAIPLLASLLSDQRLVRASGADGLEFAPPEFDEEPMNDEEIEREWESFPRPLTCAEVARRILSPIVAASSKNGDDEAAPVSAESLAALAREWHALHRGDSRATLRRHFLAAGAANVVAELVQSDDPADRAAIEEFVLAAEDPRERLEIVLAMARRHGPGAKEFVARFLAKVAQGETARAQSGEGGGDAGVGGMIDQRWRAQVKSLNELVSDKTGADLLQELVAGRTAWDPLKARKAAPALMAKLAREEPAAAITALLEASLAAQNDALALFCVQLIHPVLWTRAREHPEAAATPLTIGATGALWKRVLDRKREVDPEAYGIKLADFDSETLVALLIETLYAREEENADADAFGILGARLYPIAVQRARARLDGVTGADLPRYPSAATVGAERRAELSRLLQDTAPEQVLDLAARWSLADLLVAPSLVGADPKLNGKLVPVSHLVREVRLDERNAALVAFFRPLVGKPFDRALVETLIAECRRQAARGTLVTVSCERSAPLAGVALRVVEKPAPAAVAAGGGEWPQPPTLRVVLQASGARPIGAGAEWPIEMPQPAAGKPAAGEDDDLLPSSGGSGDYQQRMQTDFWAKFQELFLPERSIADPYQCSLRVQWPQPPDVQDESEDEPVFVK